MKKVLSIVLAIAMIATMSVVAFAGEKTFGDDVAIPDGGYEQTIDVTGKYSDDQTDIDTYKIELSWNDLEEITFTDSNKNTWNTTTHKWDVAPNGGWSAEEVTLTVNVENHSSQDVKVGLTYEDKAGGAETALKADVEDVTVTVGKAALNETEETNPEGTKGVIAGTITVGGRITEAEAGVMGTFTVAINAADAPVVEG